MKDDKFIVDRFFLFFRAVLCHGDKVEAMSQDFTAETERSRLNYLVSCCILYYQSPPILTALFQHNLINVSYLTACYLYQVMMMLHFLYDVANDAESTQKSEITSKSLL